MLEGSTTVLVAAGSYDLVDLPTVKDELELAIIDTSKDVWLGRAITQVSAAMAKYCNRVFPMETVLATIYPERDAYPYQVPGGTDPLQLARWPVQMGIVTLSAPAETDSGNVLAFSSTAGVCVGQPVSHPSVPIGTTVSEVASGSITLSAPIAGPVRSADAVTFGIAVTVTDGAAPTTLRLNQDFRILPREGQLVRLSPFTAYPMPWDPVLTQVAYQGGYATIPADLVDAALRVITARYAARGRDPLLKAQDQPGLGHQTYWIGSAPGVKGAFTEEIRGLLGTYRVPVTA